MAGRYWLKGFLEKFPNLKKKNAKNLSIHRAKCANKVLISKFFQELTQWVREWKLEYKPFHIWNVDESGVGDVPNEQQVIGITGVPASQTVAGEKPQNTTVVTYASAGGLCMPPMIIFKAGKVDSSWREAAPSGYAIRSSKTGYINQQLFAEYGELFVRFLKEKHLLGNNQKVLLLLDSHKSHLFNLQFMTYMSSNGVEVCCFPPHCTHLLQPLDDVPFAHFKGCYQKELADWNLKHLGRKMTRIEFFRVFVPPYTKAMMPQTIQKGFSNTGIYPVNPHASKLQRIGPSIVSDRFSKCKKFVLVQFQLPVRSETFGARINMRHADKQDSYKTFNRSIFFPLQVMITRLLEQMRQVSRRVRPRSWMRLQEGYLSQMKLKFQPRLMLRTLMTMRGKKLTRKLMRKLMRKLTRRLKTLSGMRKQLFRYL